MQELQELLNRVRTESESAGLSLNAKRTKVIKIQRQDSNEEEKYLTKRQKAIWKYEIIHISGSCFNKNYEDSVEIKQRIAIAENSTGARTKIWKDKSIWDGFL